MKYNIKDLMNEFKDLGGSIGKYGFPIYQDDEYEDDLVIGEFYRSLDNNRREYIEKVKSATPEQRKSLEAEFNAKQQKIKDEIERWEYQKDSNKARAVYTLIELAKKLHEIGIDVSEEISKDDLEKLFVLLGGRISESGYEIPETPETIKTIESEIARLYKENYQAGDPFTLLYENEEKLNEFMIANIKKIDSLREQLEQEINDHPEYLKIKTILDAIESINDLEKFHARQKAFGK